MLISKSLRVTGSCFGIGKQRVISNLIARRQISLKTYTRPTHPSRLRNLQYANQTRSISLFGWGSSASSSNQNAPTATNEAGVEIGNTSLSDVRTYKASHATAEAPEPSLPHHPASAVEPPTVGAVQEAIAFPAASEKVTGIIDGEVDISSIPERLGYLKEVCGLDYGWGPTAFIEWTLEHLHMTAGLSWATSIIVVAALTRLALVQPTINAQKESAKLKELQPIIAPLREKVNQYTKEGNRQKQLEASTEMRSIYKEYNVKLSRVFLPLVIQLPIQFGAFRLLNAAGRLPVPGFVDESWLWNHDLSFSDPYYLTPALSAFFMWLQIKQQAKTQATGGPMNPALMKLIGNVLPVMSLVFMSMQPGAVQLYFVTTSLFALVNGEALRTNGIRKFLSLPELPSPSDASSSTGFPQPSSLSSGTAASGKPAPTIIKPRSNGFQLRAQPPAPTVEQVSQSSSSTASSSSDRSAIDKFIDSAKGSGWGKNLKEVTQGLRQTDADKQREQDQKYEASRSQALDVEREMRNTAAKESRTRRPS